MKINGKYLLLLILVILIWGMSFPVMKVGLQYLPPVEFAAGRLIIACITMFFIVIVSRNFVWPSRKDLPIILSIGLLQLGIFTVLLTCGLQLVDAARSAILIYTMTFSAIFLHEPITLIKFIAMGLILVGLGCPVMASKK